MRCVRPSAAFKRFDRIFYDDNAVAAFEQSLGCKTDAIFRRYTEDYEFFIIAQ